MRNLTVALVFLLAALGAAVLAQNPKYPPLSDYMMTPEAEINLARSAAPGSVSEHPTVEILTTSGYKIAAQGTNGFACVVMRGWLRPRTLPRSSVTRFMTPPCVPPSVSTRQQARKYSRYYELRSKLGMKGKTPDQISESVQAARRHMPRASFRGGMRFRSHTCGQQIRTRERALATGIRT